MARDGARQRELRYLGKLLRRVDTAPLHAALDADGQQARREAHRLHQVEALREALLSDPEPTLAQLASEHGEDSLAEIRALLDQIARLPEGGERKKRTRSLFRVLRALPEARG
jgi:ribosome-associated protein